MLRMGEAVIRFISHLLSRFILSSFPHTVLRNICAVSALQGTHFVITGLLFACKYRVAVKPVTGQEQRSEVMTSVTTPLCSSLMGRRKKPAACARDGRMISSTRLAG